MAIVGDQPVTSYTDVTPHKRAITDAILLTSPQDVPLVNYWGLDAGPEKFRVVNWPHTKVEWLEDELADLTDSLGASCSSTATSLTVADGSVFNVGDVIEIDSEMIWISAISSNTLTVTRNYGGTQASHANSAVATIINQARLESADAGYKRGIMDITAGFNYSQIFQEDLKVSRTQEKLSQYGIANEFDYQIAKAVPHLCRLIEKAVFRGQRKAGSGTTPRAWGGLETFVTTNTSSLASAALTEKALLDAVESCWNYGGMPDLIVCNSRVKRKIGSFYGGYVRTTRDESRGGVVIDEVETDFGVLKVLMDRWCPAAKLYIVQSDLIGFVAYDAFFQEDLAKVGDEHRGQVVGEYTFVVRNAKAHAMIKSISTTS